MRAWFGAQGHTTKEKQATQDQRDQRDQRKSGQRASGQLGEAQLRARGPTVLSHRKSDVKVQVQEVGEPKTHMGAIGPQPPIPPACATTPAASVERLFILFRPLCLFPRSAASQHHPPASQPASSVCLLLYA